jgi:hypothetical protein
VGLRYVALMTRDPAVYAELAGLMRGRGFPLLSLLPGDRIPERVAVVLTSVAESARIRHPAVIPVTINPDRASVLAAVAHAYGRGDPRGELVLGIDPGPRPGYALLAEHRCLIEGSLPAPEGARDLARELARRFPERDLRIRVGSGDQICRHRIVKALWELGRPIELVDEHGTTPRGPREGRDPIAARRIAAGRGPVLREPTPMHITPGAISDLQRQSRESSGGHLTISRALASRVLGGELTLAQALEQGRARMRTGGAARAGSPGGPGLPP